MALINFKEKVIQVKIVYYGPGRSGKTTNLVYIYNKLNQKMGKSLTSKLISIDTKGERTLFFDFFPLELGKVQGLDLKIQLYTTPGQVVYNSTRKLVLKGVDGIVFVADSLSSRKEANIESLQNLQDNLKDYNLSLDDVPLVFQWNKRDLESDVPLLSIEEMHNDLNRDLNRPAFPASALTGFNVFETLRIASRLTLKSALQKISAGKLAVGG